MFLLAKHGAESPDATRTRRLWIRGVIANYLQMAAGLLSIVVLTPLALKHVGTPAYGFWAVIGSLQTYGLLFDFGMNTAAAKYTSEYRTLQRSEELSRLVSTVLVLVLWLGGIVFAVAVAAAPWVPSLLGMPPALARTARTAVIVTGLNAAVLLVAGVLGNVIYGHQRTDVWKLFGTIQIVANMVIAIVFLRFGFGIVGLAWAAVMANLTLVSLCIWFLRKRLMEITISLRLVSLGTFREIWPYSVRAFGMNLTSRLLYYTDYVIIGLFLGAAAVAPYEIGYKLCFLSTYLFSVLSFVSFPRFTELWTARRQVEVSQAYLRLVKATMLVLVPVEIFLLVWGQALIRFWVGEANTLELNVLLVLIAMNAFHAIGTPASTFLQGVGRNRELVWSEMLNALLNLGLSIMLVQQVGILGVAMATLVAHVATSFWVAVLLPCRMLGLPIRRYALSAVLPPIAVGCPFLLLLRVPLAEPSTLADFGVAATGLCLAYLAVYMLFGATRDEREQMKGLLPQLR